MRDVLEVPSKFVVYGLPDCSTDAQLNGFLHRRERERERERERQRQRHTEREGGREREREM